MVSIVERLLVLNIFQKPPKSWLLNKSGYISREVNDGARTVLMYLAEYVLCIIVLRSLKGLFTNYFRY